MKRNGKLVHLINEFISQPLWSAFGFIAVEHESLLNATKAPAGMTTQTDSQTDRQRETHTGLNIPVPREKAVCCWSGSEIQKTTDTDTFAY